MGEMVTCDLHGETPLAFACRHAAGGIACGFWMSTPDPAYGRPDATCDLCDERMRAGEEIDAKEIVILCTYCWDEARARNESVPQHVRGKRTRLTKTERAALVHHAVHELQAKQQQLQSRWNIGVGMKATSFMRWFFDADTRTVTSSEADTPRVIADVKMVGTYAKKSGTFQWSWHTYGS
jgi:hypothetical protein